MYFQILKLVLWPRKDASPQIIPFEKGVVNVITGASKTGKSAVIPIIDYCLGAEKCAIPVGVIRKHCAWFGVVMETGEGQLLLARREPGEQQSTSEMYMQSGTEIVVPEVIAAKNTTVETVKSELNRLAGLTSLGFEFESDSGFNGRPSFRDLTAFIFQPQNIVANPNVVFFKADMTQHREKLKTIFPYILGAVTPRTLFVRYQIDQLSRQLKRKLSQLAAVRATSERWVREGGTKLRQAVDLGLLPANERISDSWDEIVDRLRALVSRRGDRAAPSTKGYDSVFDRLKELREEESLVSAQLTEQRQHLRELRRLTESTVAYGDSVRLQRDRLALSSWLAERAQGQADAILALDADGDDRINSLCDALSVMEVQLRTYPFMAESLEREELKRRELADEAVARLGEVRKEIAALEAESEEGQRLIAHGYAVERFLGGLEQSLLFYEEADPSSLLQFEVDRLQSRIDALSSEVEESNIYVRQRSALNELQGLAGAVVPGLDAEDPHAAVQLDIRELTVLVSHEGREDRLWEIGSGANWLAYHIAITVALQQFFLRHAPHPVPGLLVYDQPSQVYFPKRALKDDDEDARVEWEEDDIEQVRKVFKVLDKAVADAKGRLQILVMDHAHDEVWGNLPSVFLCDEWRGGRKLVPVDWLGEERGRQ
jgi:hypothetical protein